MLALMTKVSGSRPSRSITSKNLLLGTFPVKTWMGPIISTASMRDLPSIISYPSPSRISLARSWRVLALISSLSARSSSGVIAGNRLHAGRILRRSRQPIIALPHAAAGRGGFFFTDGGAFDRPRDHPPPFPRGLIQLSPHLHQMICGGGGRPV